MPGDYYLEIYGTPVNISNIKSYNFNLSSTLSTDNFELIEFVVHPNPTKNLINFNNSKSKFKNLEIYNVVGQLLKNINIVDSSQNSIDISSYEEGIYIFKFRKPNVLKTIRVIKM